MVVRWDELRADFIAWSERIAGHSEKHRRDLLSYLDRYLSGHEIRSDEDIRAIVMACGRGQRHLKLALKNLFNFLEWLGWPEELLDKWRKLVKLERCGHDCHVPSEEDIIRSLKVLAEANPKYWALYNVLLDSGARLVHAIEVLNGWDEKCLMEAPEGFYIYALSRTSGSKQQPYVFLTPYTIQLIRALRASGGFKPIGENAAKQYYRKKVKRGVVLAKYVRKFVFTKLVALGVPESVADFIQGRAARTVGARHYLAKLELAKQHYARYARYLAELRAKAGLMAN